MPTERETSFIGTCVRVSGADATVDVRMQRHGATLRDVSASAQTLFPPRGEVELTDAGSLHPGDWVAFRIASDLSPSTSSAPVTGHRRLLPLEDLSDLGSSEAVRRLLVEVGRADGAPGEIMIRAGDRELVRLNLAQEPDGRWRAVPDQDMWRLPVWRFDPKRCLAFMADGEQKLLLDPDEPLVQIGTFDWSRDIDFVRRILRSLTRVEAAEDQALRQFAEALGRFAERLQPGSPPQSPDPRVAQEILRLRKLAAMLREQQDVLAAYYDALRTDPEVKSLLETHIARLAQETIQAQRATLIEQLAAELDEHFAALRAERETELRKSCEELSQEMIRDLERHRARNLAEVEARLAQREREGREELETTLYAERRELEAEVSNLEKRHAALFEEVQQVGERERDLSMAVAALAAKERDVVENLERLRSEREAEIRKSMEELSSRMTTDLERRIALRSAELEADLADRERQGHQTLEAALGEKRVALEAAVAGLEDRHVVLGNTIDLLERRERELMAAVDGLSFKEASGLEALELRRAEREAEIKKSIEILSGGMMSDLERRIAARSAELEAELADRERQARTELDNSLGRTRADLEAELSRLGTLRGSLGAHIDELQQRARELTSSVEGLASRETRVLAEIEQRRTEREAEVKKSIEDLSARMVGDLERRLAARMAEFEATLSDREKQAREELQNSLGAKRAELHAEVSALEHRRSTLSKEVQHLAEKERELVGSLEELSSREASQVQAVARLSRRIVEEAPGPARIAPSASGT